MTAGEVQAKSQAPSTLEGWRSPSPFVHTNDIARRLEAAGFVRQVVQQEWMTRGIFVLKNEEVAKDRNPTARERKSPALSPRQPGTVGFWLCLVADGRMARRAILRAFKDPSRNPGLTQQDLQACQGNGPLTGMTRVQTRKELQRRWTEFGQPIDFCDEARTFP